MDLIKSIKSWKPRNGFQRKSKSLHHGQQQQHLDELQRMHDSEKEIGLNDEPLLNNKLYGAHNRAQPEYWTNESISSNASTSHLPMQEDVLSSSVSSSVTNSSSRVAVTLPAGNQSMSMFHSMNDAGKVLDNTYNQLSYKID